MFKDFVQKRLENYVKKYFAAHPDVKLIVVTGSVGKTSTKRAVGEVLSSKYRIRMHGGNYNTEIAVPMAILGIEYPKNIRNPLSWLKVFWAARARVKAKSDVDIVVQELGSDHPGDVAAFGKYLKPDMALVTAVTPEHMEFFKTLDAVAKEELSVADFSKMVLVNRDDIDGKYAAFDTNPNIFTYGSSPQAEYRALLVENSLRDGMKIEIGTIDWPKLYDAHVNLLGEHSLRPVAAAIGVAAKLGMQPNEIIDGLKRIRPIPGRMNPLRGIEDTTIIDDTYNSSPAAVKAALQTLYSFDSEAQRIAILGSMNELGESSADEHRKVGELCNPDLLQWVVVVGADAAKYLAPAAKARGCQVQVCLDAIEAAKFTRRVTEEGAVILVKGSQGGIYLEEAVKLLCVMTEDHELVRQTPEWLDIKQKYFDQIRDTKA